MFSVRYDITIAMDSMKDKELFGLIKKLEHFGFKIDYYDDNFIDITADENNEASVRAIGQFLKIFKKENKKIQSIKINLWYLDEPDKVITI